jgi:ribose/xylose/arabinose/galactoside ABC-type transport system permease subunit
MQIFQELKYNIKHKWGTQLALLIAYALLVIFFSIASPVFFSFRNFMNILSYTSVIGVTAVGMCFGITSGCRDLSVGSVIALTGIVVAQVIPTVGMFWAILAGLGMGVLCGTFNGFIITQGKIVPMIATLGTMSVFRGITYLLADGKSIMITNNAFKQIGRGYVANAIPVPVVILLTMFVIGWLILNKTVFGRTLHSIGGNSKASYLAGINIKLNRFVTFIVISVMASMSGIVATAQTGAGIPQAATGSELDIIASVILGGTSLAGGKGSMVGTFLGLLILGTLSNGMVMLNIPSFWQMVAKGAVLILAVYVDVLRGGGFERFES